MRTDRHAAQGPSAKPALLRPLAAPGLGWNSEGSKRRAAEAAADAALPDLAWRSAARRQPVAPPAALVLLLDGAVYNPERHAVEFRLLDRDRLVGGELSLAVLQNLAAIEPAASDESNDESIVATFRRLAEPVHRIAEWKYAAGRLTPEGRLQITTADLIDFHGRRTAPMPTAGARGRVGSGAGVL
jgi:hypothetical protein